MTLLPEARYDEVMAAFGGGGYLVRTVEELRRAFELSLADWQRPSLLNVLIDPSSDRKQQVIIRGCFLSAAPHTEESNIPVQDAALLHNWGKSHLMIRHLHRVSS